MKQNFMTKKMTVFSLLTVLSGLLLLAACNKMKSDDMVIRQNDKDPRSEVAVTSSKNLMFDQTAYDQFIADLADNSVKATVKALYEPQADAALSVTPKGYATIYGDTAGTSASNADAARLKALVVRWVARTSTADGQPYIDKADAILKAWAAINKPSFHRPAESIFLSFYEAYSVIRSSISSADRTAIDTWIRNRATTGANNMSLQDGNALNKINNWEAIRICFLYYSAYILDDATILTNAKTAYNTFLDKYLLAGGSTADFHDRDAVAYLQDGLLFVSEIVNAVSRIEGNTAGNTLFTKLNVNNLNISGAVALWETFLSGGYHDEFKNSIFASERTGTRRGPYNPAGGVYVLDIFIRTIPARIYPYIKNLSSNTTRFANLARYVNMLPNAGIPSSTFTKASFFKNCSYGGYNVPLGLGGYTTAQLTAAGILNDDISSLKVPAGFKVILFADDNFEGTSFTTTPGTNVFVTTTDNSCLISNSFNDKASSLMVVSAQ